MDSGEASLSVEKAVCICVSQSIVYSFLWGVWRVRLCRWGTGWESFFPKAPERLYVRSRQTKAVSGQSSRKDSLISRKILPVKCCGFSHHNCSSVFGKKLSHSLRLHIAQTLPGVYTFLLRKMLHFHKYSKIFVYNTQNTIIEIWQSVKRQYEKWKSYCNICLKMRKKK